MYSSVFPWVERGGMGCSEIQCSMALLHMKHRSQDFHVFSVFVVTSNVSTFSRHTLPAVLSSPLGSSGHLHIYAVLLLQARGHPAIPRVCHAQINIYHWSGANTHTSWCCQCKYTFLWNSDALSINIVYWCAFYSCVRSKFWFAVNLY